MASTPPSTILDPNDPALGSSYEDGVERARRVTARKKKPPGKSTKPVTSPDTILSEGLGTLGSTSPAPRNTGDAVLTSGQGILRLDDPRRNIKQKRALGTTLGGG